jgi:ABC-2 type transport system ATP-binding protein
VGDLLATHHRLIAPRGELTRLPAEVEVVQIEHGDRYSQAIVRSAGMSAPLPGRAERITLEELVLGYLTRTGGMPNSRVEAVAGEVRR